MGNALATVALLAWPVLCLAFFARFRPPVAGMLCFMGSMLFLPEKVELKAPFQPLGKQEVAAIGAMLGVLLVGAARRRLVAAKPFFGAEIWIVFFMLGSFGTSMVNKEPIAPGSVVLPPLTTWEAVSVAVGDVYSCLIPFILGRALFQTRDDARTLLRGMQLGALVYFPFIFTEILLSPQMHNWVYGFAQHDFIQTMRAGGYRPMVFMGHGLGLTLFLAAAILAGFVLTLAKIPGIFRIRGRHMAIITLVVLIGCKSLGAAIFAFMFAGVLSFFSAKWQMRVLVLFALLVLFYPVSRAAEIFPHKEMIKALKDAAGEDRAASMEFRFVNEAKLAEHAGNKPIFGWGRFRRNMLFAPWSENPTSVGDGYWINIYGIRGAWGFICFFGLMLTPLFYVRSRIKKLTNSSDRYLLVGSCCILMMYTIDLLPNGLFTNFPVFFAGAIMGLAKGMTGSTQPQMQMQMQQVMVPTMPAPTFATPIAPTSRSSI